MTRFRKVNEGVLFLKHLNIRFNNTSIVKRTMNWYQSYYTIDPTMREINKFRPTKDLFRWKKWFALFGSLMGFQAYLIFDKIYRVKNTIDRNRMIILLENQDQWYLINIQYII